MLSSDHLREAACLAHTVPGTTLRLVTAVGQSLLVSRHCLGADLSPCQLRSMLLCRTGEHLAVAVTRIDLVAGLAHVGGGIHARHGVGGIDERWFVTTLRHEHVEALLATCPVVGTEHLDVSLAPDLELGLCAVRLAADAHDPVLDEAALWSMAACLTDELVSDVMTGQLR